jgi:excisionase family DNA binding protein
MTEIDRIFRDLPVHLTVPQLCQALGVSRGTVYEWLKTGVVPAYKMGSTWVILRDEVLEHVRSTRNIPAAPTGDN